jgi:hypothetical protein
MSETVRDFGPASKVSLVFRIWVWLVFVSWRLRRDALPDLVRRLGTVDVRSRRPRVEAARLGRIVWRVLRIGPWRPRCLLQALVLYRLLRTQGETVEVVIGLPREPKDKDAHAWVELDGHDVGPPPGRAGHEVLARYV